MSSPSNFSLLHSMDSTSREGRRWTEHTGFQKRREAFPCQCRSYDGRPEWGNVLRPISSFDILAPNVTAQESFCEIMQFGLWSASRQICRQDVLRLSLEIILDSEHEKIYVYLKGQRIGNVHIVWRRTPVGQVVCIADPLQEIQFIGIQRGFRLLKVPMAPCHNDNCPSWSSDPCKLTNKLVQESVNNSSTAQSFASKQCTEKNPK
jgi:hypothetical protein